MKILSWLHLPDRNVAHQGYQNFFWMPATVSDLSQECIYHCIKKEVTHFRKSLKVGLKLAITLRHLATRPYSITAWLAKPPLVNLFPSSTRQSLMNSRKSNCAAIPLLKTGTRLRSSAPDEMFPTPLGH